MHQLQPELPVMEGDEDLWREADILPSRTYRIEVVNDTGEEYVARYEATCSTDQVNNIGIRVNVFDDTIRFHQSNCSSGNLLRPG